MTTVVTGFHPAGHALYGQRFLETFDAFWPSNIQLRCYVEESVPVPRDGLRSLWSCDGVDDFIQRHSRSAEKNGRAPLPAWRPKDHRTGYAYRFDSVKFSRQCFIPEQAAHELADGEILAWMDADVVTFKPVPEGFIESLIAEADLVYLGRVRFHSELGFWAVRLNSRTRQFLASLAALYREDKIFNLREWHSAFAFDHLRGQHRQMITRNLTPYGRSHVWFQSPLAQFTDHLKGSERKERGRSLEREPRIG
jgi:hypothetical protein